MCMLMRMNGGVCGWMHALGVFYGCVRVFACTGQVCCTGVRVCGCVHALGCMGVCMCQVCFTGGCELASCARWLCWLSMID